MFVTSGSCNGGEATCAYRPKVTSSENFGHRTDVVLGGTIRSNLAAAPLSNVESNIVYDSDGSDFGCIKKMNLYGVEFNYFTIAIVSLTNSTFARGTVIVA